MSMGYLASVVKELYHNLKYICYRIVVNSLHQIVQIQIQQQIHELGTVKYI